MRNQPPLGGRPLDVVPIIANVLDTRQINKKSQIIYGSSRKYIESWYSGLFKPDSASTREGYTRARASRSARAVADLWKLARFGHGFGQAKHVISDKVTHGASELLQGSRRTCGSVEAVASGLSNKKLYGHEHLSFGISQLSIVVIIIITMMFYGDYLPMRHCDHSMIKGM
jgi:hypothetical protein